MYRGIAQVRSEPMVDNREVGGSNPSSPTKFDLNADLREVYKRLAKTWAPGRQGYASPS